MKSASAVVAVAASIIVLGAPGQAGSAPLTGAHVDLYLNNHSLEVLSEFGVLTRPVEPAHFAGGATRFPFDRGRLTLGRHRSGSIEALGGESYFRDDGRSVTFFDPRIVIRMHSARVLMDAGRGVVRFARVPRYEIERDGRRVELKGFARYSAQGASVINETFDISYPGPGTALGFLDINATLPRR